MADTLVEALPKIMNRGVQLAVLGTGDCACENKFREAAGRHSGQLAVRIGYAEALAHRFHGGADILLHPARFEPCGLTQLYAMRYGTLPIGRRVGGLADTIIDASNGNLEHGKANGFTFEEPTGEDLISGLDRALSFYGRPAWRAMQRRAMHQDFGWTQSAKRYIELYNGVAPDAAIDTSGSCEEPVERLAS